ncbi:hypothetical protein VNO77_44404 [Canavalia gladiata]|uniref:Uncharacterized protein n=1 Tax=Canavalia gladiata TaxID=3824 RepID=A0AAN9JY64_CANGL
MSRDQEKTNKLLFKLCMKGKWEEVVEMYRNDKKVWKARITRLGDTALHVAVADGKDDVVQQLVKLICWEEDEEGKEALRIENERGNTVLHFAASMGSVQTCEYIASAEVSLLNIRNVDGETPLFLAAMHGRKDAFLSLHYYYYYNICTQAHPNHPNYYSNCTRNDGDTVLHSAIAGDYFDLAFQIIHLFKDFANRKNQRGFSPLHLLASKPSAFRSGSHFGLFQTIVYHGIFVKPLEVASYCQQLHPTVGKEKNGYPENYKTCINLLRVIKNAASVGR